MTYAALAVLALAGGALPAADLASIDAFVARIYAPYRDEASAGAAWERPVFSAGTATLIARWQKVMPADEVDSLNDGDWFCLCQDWDSTRFSYRIVSRKPLSGGLVQATVRFDLGWGESREQRMVLRREGGGWRLDDMFSREGFPRGLRQALRETIAEDERLAK